MSYPHLSSDQQLRLHGLIVAKTISIIGGPRAMGEAKALEAVVQFYRRLPDDVRGVILHEEPIYVAGEILGLSTRDIDGLPEEVWHRFHRVYDETSMAAFHGDGLRDVPRLGRIGPGEHYELEPLPLGPTPGLG